MCSRPLTTSRAPVCVGSGSLAKSGCVESLQGADGECCASGRGLVGCVKAGCFSGRTAMSWQESPHSGRNQSCPGGLMFLSGSRVADGKATLSAASCACFVASLDVSRARDGEEKTKLGRCRRCRQR